MHPKPTPQRHGKQPQRRAALRCCPPLFCHGFCKPTHLQHLYFFLKDKKKNTRAAATARTKTPAKKDGGKLNNIMNLIVFFSLAHASMPTHKKKIL
jgi:hypothetical protein